MFLKAFRGGRCPPLLLKRFGLEAPAAFAKEPLADEYLEPPTATDRITSGEKWIGAPLITDGGIRAVT